MKQVFISHSTADKALADEICILLERRGVSCWIAPRDIDLGKAYGEEIIHAIEQTAAMILVLSESSNQSVAVRNEVERAFSYGKTVIPVRIREVKPSKGLEFFISTAQWIDAWDAPLESKMDQLTQTIQVLSGSEPSHPVRAALAKARPAISSKKKKGLLIAAILLGLGAAWLGVGIIKPALNGGAGMPREDVSIIQNRKVKHFDGLEKKNAFDIFSNTEAAVCFTKVVGAEHFSQLKNSMLVSGAVTQHDSFLFGSGNMPHNEGRVEAAYILDQSNGNCYVSMLTNGKIETFPVVGNQELPQPLKIWIAGKQTALVATSAQSIEGDPSWYIPRETLPLEILSLVGKTYRVDRKPPNELGYYFRITDWAATKFRFTVETLGKDKLLSDALIVIDEDTRSVTGKLETVRILDAISYPQRGEDEEHVFAECVVGGQHIEMAYLTYGGATDKEGGFQPIQAWQLSSKGSLLHLKPSLVKCVKVEVG